MVAEPDLIKRILIAKRATPGASEVLIPRRHLPELKRVFKRLLIEFRVPPPPHKYVRLLGLSVRFVDKGELVVR